MKLAADRSSTGLWFSDEILFRGCLLLLIWSPLPMGSNRPWAVALIVTWVMILLAAWLLLYWQRKVDFTNAFMRGSLALGLLAVSGLWCKLQVYPIDRSNLEVFSREAFQIVKPVLGWDGFEPSLSLDPAASKVAFLKATGYLAFFALTLLLVNSRSRIQTLVITVVISGVIQAFWGAGMTLTGAEYGFFVEKNAYVGTATGTFVNRNHLAGYLEMALALGIGLMLISSEQSDSNHWRARLRSLLKILLGPKARLRLGLVIMVIALVLTRSRMGNTAFFSSLMIAGSLALLLFRGAKTSTVLLLASLLVIDIFIVGTWFGIKQVADRLQQTTVQAEERDEVDQYSLRGLYDFGLFGSGAGSFYSALPQYKTASTQGFFDHAHNDYLEFGFELGAIGFLPLATAVAISFAAAIQAMRKRRNSLNRGIAFGSMMGILSLLIHSAVDFNLQIPANALLFTVLLALAWIALVFDDKVSLG